jgi:hypothetical protein
MSKIDISKIEMFATFLLPILIYPPPPRNPEAGALAWLPPLPVPMERDHFRDLGVDVKIILK